jgi:hypothetical protein
LDIATYLSLNKLFGSFATRRRNMNSKIDIAKTLSPLAEAMKAKKDIGEPYVLCLGEGATLSSGCRAMRWAVRNIIAEEHPLALDNVLADLSRPERCGLDSKKFEQLLTTLNEDQWYPPLLKEFFDLLDQRSGQEQKQLLEPFFSEEYPSAGYKFLAVLAREGFFQIVFNANYDPLLEIALRRYLPLTDAQGRPLQSFQRLINRADSSVKTEIKNAFASRAPRIKALWLHGHLWEPSGIAFTPREKRNWYPNIKDVVEEHFGQDLLLIGYTDRDDDILLAVQNAPGNGAIWYVAPDRPDIYMARALGARNREIISGQAADFDTFCQMLFDLTLDLTDPKQVQKNDTRRLELLQEKQRILEDYVETLERRRREDPMAPPSLQVQQEVLQREAQAIEETLKSLR